MKRRLVIAATCLSATALGVAGWIAFRGVGEEDAEEVRAHAKLMEELAGKRDHIKLVISGRLLAEIYPCG